MSTMITEVYNAFRKAGVPESEAQAAAEALSNETSATKADITNLDKKLYTIESDMKIIKWTQGLIIAILVIPFLKEIIS